MLSSPEERVRRCGLVRRVVLELPAPEPPELELGAIASGVTGAAVPDVTALELVDVLVVRLGAERRGVLRRGVVVRGVVCSVAAGARRRPAEIGSEESPMCWLVNWLVAQVIPAASTIPSSAASAHRAVWRLMRAP